MKTRSPKPLILALALAVSGVPLPSAVAEDPQIPAVSALRRVGTLHGDKYISKIVRMRGKGGQPQPREWWITVYDPAAPYLVHEFWVGDTRATDEGPNTDYYPVQTPPGFIPAQNIKLDSVDAFEVLNQEANRAKIGFDSVNYFLRCREFSEEPVWTLQAINTKGASVGFVDLSAQTGKVLRTVWFHPDPTGQRRAPRIADSELLGRTRSDVLEGPGSDERPTGPGPSVPGVSELPVDPLTGRPERLVDPERLAPGVREIPLDEPPVPSPGPLPGAAPRPRNVPPSPVPVPVPVNPDADTEVPEVVPLDGDE